MTDFNDLIPELPTWNGGEGIDVESWIGCEGDFQHAIGYSVIFWPEFTLHEDMIFGKNFSHEALAGFLKQADGNKTSVEKVMNHLHIVDIHHGGCPDASRERIVYLGNVLKEIYSCKLKCQFPDLRIVVCFDDTPKENLMDYQLTFYQER